MPANVVDVARLLLDRGADVDAVTLGRNGGPTLGLVVTSKMASDANASGPLIQLLIDRGATIGGEPPSSIIANPGDRNLLHPSLANHAPRAAEKLIAKSVDKSVQDKVLQDSAAGLDKWTKGKN